MTHAPGSGNVGDTRQRKDMDMEITTYEAPRTIGTPSNRRPITGYVIVEGVRFEVMPNMRAVEICEDCNGTGYRPGFEFAYEGVCFPCNTSGVRPGTKSHHIDDLPKVLKRRAQAQADLIVWILCGSGPGKGTGADGEGSEGAEGSKSSNGVSAECGCGRKLRMSHKAWAEGPVICGSCMGAFEARS